MNHSSAKDNSDRDGNFEMCHSYTKDNSGIEELTYSYFPGCTLKTKATALDKNARLAAEVVGVKLCEIPEWQCCGAVYPLATDEIATRLSAVRALKTARDSGNGLVTLCSACHHVIKRVNIDIRENRAGIRDKVDAYMQEEGGYDGETQVLHLLEVLRDKVGFDRLSEMVKTPLAGRKIGAYYGCLLLRPASEMAFDDAESPTIMEDFIASLGAEPVVYPWRNECCGGYLSVTDNDAPKRMCGEIMSSAQESGAELIITACPLCRYNLDKHNDSAVGVQYFTELLAEALGVGEGVAI